jgi:hypothetical protein
VVTKTDRSDKIEIKKSITKIFESYSWLKVLLIKKFFLKISGHQQRWPRPLPGAILIPPAPQVVADYASSWTAWDAICPGTLRAEKCDIHDPCSEAELHV